MRHLRGKNLFEIDIWRCYARRRDVFWDFAQRSLWRCPWCAVINIGQGTVYWDCQYRTFEACYHLGNILAGNRGFCNVNPWPGPSLVVPYKHPKRHAQY
jgi:hypothetical protein